MLKQSIPGSLPKNIFGGGGGRGRERGKRGRERGKRGRGGRGRTCTSTWWRTIKSLHMHWFLIRK
jgi:hypothetical protein